MKRLVAVVVVVAFVLNCASTLSHYEYQVYEREQPIVISERVGEIIDTEEGERFALFYEIKEFKEAQFYAIEDGGYVVEIMTDDKKLAAINCDQNAIMILRDYINKYEEISADRAAFESKWNILDYDTLGVPITENEVRRVMNQTRGRAVIRGLTCFSGSSCLGLLFGLGIAAGGAGSGTDIGPALGVTGGLIVLGAVASIGLVAAGTMIAITYSKNTASFLQTIKEARKPKAYGIRASARMPGAVE